MLLTKLKILTLFLVVAMLGGGATGLAYHAVATEPGAAKQRPAAAPTAPAAAPPEGPRRGRSQDEGRKTADGRPGRNFANGVIENVDAEKSSSKWPSRRSAASTAKARPK